MSDNLRLEADATPGVKAAEEFEAAIEKIEQALDNFAKKGAGAFEELKKASEGIELNKTSQDMNATARAGNSMAGAVDQAGTAATGTAADFRRLSQENERLTQRLNDLERSKRRTTIAANDLSGRLRQMATTVAVMHGPLGGIASRLTGMATLFGNIGFAAGSATLGIGAVTFATTAATRVFIEAEMSLTRMEAALRANGDATGFTNRQLDSLARTLGRETMTSANEARQAITVLSTAVGLQGEQFERTLRLAQDMSEVFGGSLVSNVQRLSSAFQAPTEALQRMRRHIRLDDEVMETVRALERAGDATQAWEVALTALESRVGGVGREVGQTLGGALDTLGENLREGMEWFAGYSNSASTLKWMIDALNVSFERMLSLTRDVNQMSTDDITKELVNQHNSIQEINALVEAGHMHWRRGANLVKQHQERIEELHAAYGRAAHAEREAAEAADRAATERRVEEERRRGRRVLEAAGQWGDRYRHLMMDQADVDIERALGAFDFDVGEEEARQLEERIRLYHRRREEIEATRQAEMERARELERQRREEEREAARQAAALEARRTQTQALVDTLEPLKARTREYREQLAMLQEIEWDSVEAGMSREEAIARLTKRYEESADPFRNMTDNIRREIELTQMSNREHERQILLQRQINELTAQGVEVTDEMVEKLKELNAELEELNTPRGFDSFIDSMPEVNDALDQIEEKIGRDIADAVAEFAHTGEMDFKSMIDSWNRELVRFASQELFKSIFSGAGGFLAGSLGGFFGGGGEGEAVAAVTASRGGISDQMTPSMSVPAASFSGAPGFASGTPNTTGGIPAILHPNEAVIPLSGNRKVPVEMQGGGGDNINVNFVVNSPNPDSFRRSQSQIENDVLSALQRARSRNG